VFFVNYYYFHAIALPVSPFQRYPGRALKQPLREGSQAKLTDNCKAANPDFGAGKTAKSAA
jgi:hypothetical protein